MLDSNVLEACKAGIATWQKAFNKQDAAGCAAQYIQDATMEARPMGAFNGRSEIQVFWQNIMDQGFKEVEYSDVNWQKEGDDGYILTSNWTMNKAFGVVHREHWQVQADGKALLISDLFEILGER